jgi:hypothetical protein
VYWCARCRLFICDASGDGGRHADRAEHHSCQTGFGHTEPERHTDPHQNPRARYYTRHIHQNPDGDPQQNAHSDCENRQDRYQDAISVQNTIVHPYLGSNIYPDVYPDTDSDVYPDGYPDVYPDTDFDIHPDTDSDIHPDSDSDVYPDTDSDVYPDSYTDAYHCFGAHRCRLESFIGVSRRELDRLGHQYLRPDNVPGQ